MLLLIWVMSTLWKYLLAQVIEDLEYFFFITRKNIKTNICSFILGANISSKDIGMLTPLHRAAASRNEVPIAQNTNKLRGKVCHYACVLDFSCLFFF